MFDNQVDQIIDEIDKIFEHLEQMQPDLKVVSILLLLPVSLSSKRGTDGRPTVGPFPVWWPRVFRICTVQIYDLL
jgi:hypothetical protein